MIIRITLLVCALCMTTGCVERTLRFTSNVPARVYLDRVEIGVTPVEVNFDNYGTRRYTLRTDGYNVTSGEIEMSTPWYQYPPIDFFAEIILPIEIVDDHHVHVDLEPLSPADYGNLRARAGAYRQQSLHDTASHIPKERLPQEQGSDD